MVKRHPLSAMDAEGPARKPRLMLMHAATALLVFSICRPSPLPAAEPTEEPRSKTDEIFTTTKVWPIHLRFTAEEWAAMEPKQNGPAPFGGGPPGGPRPGEPGQFAPATFLMPPFLKDGDANQDGVLSKEEFQTLAATWYSTWDKEKAGQLTAEQLRPGINASFASPNFGPPPGGPGGAPPGLFLQGAEGKRNGLMSMMGVEFEWVHADIDFGGKEFKDVAVRYKGNGTFMESRASTKRSFKIELNKYVKGQKLKGLTTLNLHCNVTDTSWMNEILSYRLYRDAKVPAPRTAYARVSITVPGKYDHQYIGLYSMVEDIDKDFVEANFNKKKGAILKPVTPNLFTDLGSEWAKYKQTYDPKTVLSVDEAQRVIDFSRLVTNADDAEFAAKAGDYLAIDEFASYMAVTVWLSTLDSILAVGQNYYVFLHPKTDKFHFIPWDLDHSFGQFPIIGSQEQRDALSIRHPWQGERRFLDRVFKLEAFKKAYLAKLDEFSKTIFQPERLVKQVDEIAAAIRPAIEEESKEKLAQFDKVVAGESIRRTTFPGAPPVKPIRTFVKARAESVVDQLAGKSDGQKLDDGPRPGGRGGPGAPGGFGPGGFLGRIFVTDFDADKNAGLTRDEFTQGFTKWFEKWNTDQSGTLTDEQLRAGINRDLEPSRGRRPGAPGGPGSPPTPNAPPPAP